MSTLLGPSPRTGRGARDVRPSVAGSAVLAAVQAATSSLVLVLVPVVVTWITATDQAVWTQVVRLSFAIWLLAHHGGLAVTGGHVGLVPLGLACVPLASCWFSGRRLARVVDPHGDRAARGARRLSSPPVPVRALALFVSAYATFAGVTAALASMPGMQPIVPQAVLGAAAVAALGGSAGAAAYRHGTARAAAGALARRLPGVSAGWVRPALAALVVHLAGSALLLVALMLVHRDRLAALHQALHPDAVGTMGLVIAQLAVAPNLLMWTASAAAGPGFAIGAGSSVGPGGVVLGALPAFPALGALPSPGPMPVAAMLVLGIPVVAGAVAGMRVMGQPVDVDEPDDGWEPVLRDVAGVAALAGVAFAVLAWLSGGPIGPGRLAVSGPTAWQAGAAFAVEVAVGALGVVAVRWGGPAAYDWFRHRSTGQ